VSGGVETQQAVLDGHLVEQRSLLVAEKRVWDPDVSPATVAETQVTRSAVSWTEYKSRIPPRLT